MALPGRASGAQVTCLNLAGYGLRGAALGLNNILGAPLLPPLAFLQGLDLHSNQLWGADPSPFPGTSLFLHTQRRRLQCRAPCPFGPTDMA